MQQSIVPQSPSEKQEVLKTKQDEINTITKELHNHYYLGKYFVDPDKNFLPLLEKIIKFFDNDELLSEIKENEHLYLNFKSKYEEALQLIQSLGEEKEKLQIALDQAKKNRRLYYSDEKNAKSAKSEFSEELLDQNSLIEQENPSLLQEAVSSDMKSKSGPKIARVNTTNTISEFNYSGEPEQPKKEETISLITYEKLKEEYLNTLKEKKEIESELEALQPLKKEYKILYGEADQLRDINEQLKEKLAAKDKEFETLTKQNTKLMNEKEGLHNDILTLREQNKICENEKTQIKIKNAHHLSKFKFMEKEISLLKKKNANLNSNIKSLCDKAEGYAEDKKAMKAKYEGKIEDLENKLELAENEKKKMSKDILGTFIETTMKKGNAVTFHYIAEKNKIIIKYQNESIGEVSNEEPVQEKGDSEESKIKTQPKVSSSPYNLAKEADVYRYRQMTKANYTNNSLYSNEKSLASPSKNCTLRKLFSNNNFSVSSKKSFGSIEKENVNSINLNLISLNPNSFADRLNQDNLRGIEIKDDFEEKKQISLTNCINKANIGKENFTFTRKGAMFNSCEIKPKTKLVLNVCSEGGINYEGEKKESKFSQLEQEKAGKIDYCGFPKEPKETVKQVVMEVEKVKVVKEVVQSKQEKFEAKELEVESKNFDLIQEKKLLETEELTLVNNDGFTLVQAPKKKENKYVKKNCEDILNSEEIYRRNHIKNEFIGYGEKEEVKETEPMGVEKKIRKLDNKPREQRGTCCQCSIY